MSLLSPQPVFAVVFSRPSIPAFVLTGCLLIPLTSCANSSAGAALQKTFAADPKLTTTASPSPSPTASSSPSPQVDPSPIQSDLPKQPTPLGSSTGQQTQASLAKVPRFSSSTNAGASGSSQKIEPQIAAGPTSFSDLDKAPKQLQSYIADLVKLGVLNLSTPNASTPNAKDSQTGSSFEPNKVMTRREFARWLVSVNNRLQANSPVQQIRLALETSQPAFQDVPRTDPDFPFIQGLAEAGLIASPLSGSSTNVTFRPDTPLTRETLLQWKLPMDTRQPLPIANLETIKQTWGFQDVAKIDSSALRSVLADFQNGEQSNIRRAFGYTTLLQPKKSVTRAEAAAALWYFGYQGEGRSAQDALKSEG